MTFPKICPGVPSRCTAIFLLAARAALLLLLVCQSGGAVAGSPAQGKKPYGLIFGTVWGPDSRPVYGVKVRIRRENEKKARWELYSDHHGEFAQRVPVGKADYIVWADLKGYKSEDGKPLQPGEPAKVHLEYDERVDTGLHLQ